MHRIGYGISIVMSNDVTGRVKFKLFSVDVMGSMSITSCPVCCNNYVTVDTGGFTCTCMINRMGDNGVLRIEGTRVPFCSRDRSVYRAK